MTEQEDKARLDVSIVIPCLNEEDYIGKLLESLADQNDAPNFEVIVVDSNSDDSTIEVAKSFLGQLPLKLMELKQRGVSLARNAGADAASGKWLFFFDAKVQVKPDYVKKIFHELQKHEADFGTSRFSTNSWHPFDKIFFWLWSYAFKVSFRKGDYLMNGSTIFIKQNLHHTIGGFDPAIEIGEDIDYARRLVRHSANGAFVPVPMFLSNRRLVHKGRINAILMAANWNNLLPQAMGRYINRDYYQRRSHPPLWRSIVRFILHATILILLVRALFLLFA